MNPHFVFSVSLFVSLLLWLPTLTACLRGDVAFAAAGLRYVIAFVLTRIALGGISRLVAAYQTPST